MNKYCNCSNNMKCHEQYKRAYTEDIRVKLAGDLHNICEICRKIENEVTHVATNNECGGDVATLNLIVQHSLAISNVAARMASVASNASVEASEKASAHMYHDNCQMEKDLSDSIAVMLQSISHLL